MYICFGKLQRQWFFSCNTNIYSMKLKAGLLLVIVAVITLEATFIIQYHYSQKEIKKEASLRAAGELKSAENKIMDVVNQAEAEVGH